MNKLEWLATHLPDATEYEIDVFIKRVGILKANCMDDEGACRYALDGLLMHRARETKDNVVAIKNEN
jgi:hypothetical protein